MHILSSILLAFSSSLDSLIIGIAYGVKNIKIKLSINLVIAIIVTITTFLSMCLGSFISNYIPVAYCSYIGSILLLIVGFYMLWDFFKKKNADTKSTEVDFINSLDYDEIIELNKTADINGSGNIEIGEAITLALSLSVNNLALGIGASISGISITLVTILTFIFSVITMILGLKLGSKYLSKLFGEYAPLLSSLIIIGMGIFEFFF